MKYLILFLSCNLFAAIPHYINQTELTNAHTKKPYTVYLRGCPGVCYDVTGKDPEVCTVQEVQIDNPEKPIYAAAVDNRDCFLYTFDPENPMPENDCRVLIQRVNIGTEEIPEYVFPLCTDKTYYALYWETDPGVYEAYCTKHLGYEQMLVKRLLLDEGLKAAKDAEIAEKLEDKTIEAKLQKLLLKYRDKIVWETIRDTEMLSAKERSAVMKKISELQKAMGK